MRSVIVLFIVAALSVSSCRKKPDPVPPQIIDHGGVSSNDGHLKVVFENMVGTQPLVLDTNVTYVNEAGNTFSVSAYKYYISNIKLWKADGTYFPEPDGYYLVNEELSASKSLIIHGVPAASYTKISFLIGVDSLRNVTGAQTGALDPANAMFWDWNTGYIMAKLEGSSPQSGAMDKRIMFHMGGFSGRNNVLREVSLELPTAVTVAADITPGIHIISDVLQWFKEPETIDFAIKYDITNPGADAATFSTGYADMFTVDHVEN